MRAIVSGGVFEVSGQYDFDFEIDFEIAKVMIPGDYVRLPGIDDSLEVTSRDFMIEKGILYLEVGFLVYDNQWTEQMRLNAIKELLMAGFKIPQYNP